MFALETYLVAGAVALVPASSELKRFGSRFGYLISTLYAAVSFLGVSLYVLCLQALLPFLSSALMPTGRDILWSAGLLIFIIGVPALTYAVYSKTMSVAIGLAAGWIAFFSISFCLLTLQQHLFGYIFYIDPVMPR